jgi:hypothetical protein
LTSTSRDSKVRSLRLNLSCKCPPGF